MNVAFLPTGRTEWEGLSKAFGSLFPAHEFHVLPSKAEMDSYPNDYPYPGFTSNPLREKDEESPPEAAVELIQRAAQEALGDRNVDAADLVIILDDVEPANIRQPDRVARVFRAAAKKHLDELRDRREPQRVQERTRDALRTRVSFHLLVPMVEALFFADPAALRAAGVPAELSAAFAGDRDPEDFNVDDTEYLSATEADCPCWLSLPSGRQKKLRPKWLGLPEWYPWPPREAPIPEQERRLLWRRGHPKGYLQWLCRDGSRKNCTTYDEVERGGNALKSLDWRAVFGRPAHHSQYLRALLADVANALGAAFEPWLSGSLATVTSPFVLRNDPILRNL